MLDRPLLLLTKLRDAREDTAIPQQAPTPSSCQEIPSLPKLVHKVGGPSRPQLETDIASVSWSLACTCAKKECMLHGPSMPEKLAFEPAELRLTRVMTCQVKKCHRHSGHRNSSTVGYTCAHPGLCCLCIRQCVKQRIIQLSHSYASSTRPSCENHQ